MPRSRRSGPGKTGRGESKTRDAVARPRDARRTARKRRTASAGTRRCVRGGMAVRTTARRPQGARRPPSARGATARSGRTAPTRRSTAAGAARPARGSGRPRPLPWRRGRRKSPFLLPLFSRDRDLTRADAVERRRSTRYARDRSPRRGSAVRAGSVADRDRPTTARRRCTAECGGGGRARRRHFLEAFSQTFESLAKPAFANEILGAVKKEGESYDTRFSWLREHFAARGGGKPGADRG